MLVYCITIPFEDSENYFSLLYVPQVIDAERRSK